MKLVTEWDGSLAIGVPEIDDQHIRILGLIGSFREDEGTVILKDRFMELLRYTREHFALEERWMSRIHYPAVERHRRQHDDLLHQVVAFAEEGIQSKSARRQFGIFLNTWLQEHILSSDAAFVAFARQRHSFSSDSSGAVS